MGRSAANRVFPPRNRSASGFPLPRLVGFNLWKRRSDLSYREVGTFDSFAQRAHVVAEYPASTLLIDDGLGLEIQFDSLEAINTAQWV